MQELEELLDSRTIAGSLYKKLEQDKVQCLACGHRCIIFSGKRGICKVRCNEKGSLKVPFGYVSSLHCDPTEKKPFFHVLPGSLSLTFGMLGCDFHCPYCQNWNISQTLRDSQAGTDILETDPEEIVQAAKKSNASLIVSSYNEPLITSEWAAAIFQLARKNGFKTAFVSNGNATPEALKFLRPCTDCYKVDLKGMRQDHYRELGGKLSTVLETIPQLVEMKFWVEVVTLVVPGFNDSDGEIKEAARFLASVSPDIPWHLTAFHKDYKMTDPNNTSAQTLIRAANIGKELGLRFVYSGNLPGQAAQLENTYCPHCHALLVERIGYQILQKKISPQGTCPSCKQTVPGLWS